MSELRTPKLYFEEIADPDFFKQVDARIRRRRKLELNKSKDKAIAFYATLLAAGQVAR